VTNKKPLGRLRRRVLRDEIGNITEDMVQEVMWRFSITVQKCFQTNGAHLTG